MTDSPNNTNDDFLRELHNPDVPVPEGLRSTVAVTSMSGLERILKSKQATSIYNWGRRNSLWPMAFGLACCAIEMIATASSRFDQARFGMEVLRATPRQADIMIVSGTVTKKMVVPIVRLYNQMSEPKYVLAMGACAIGGGPFKEGYNVISGIDKFVPVDVYVPGCPPTPQALLYGLMKMQERIGGQTLSNANSTPWYGKGPSDAVPVPVMGPDLIDPRQVHVLQHQHDAADAQAIATPADEEN